MSELLLSNEPRIRLGFFVSILLVMAVWELLGPRRKREILILLRWGNNLGIVVLNTVLLRLAFPLAAVGLATFAGQRGWGLFAAIDLPPWIAFVASMILLDLTIYLQHVMFHAAPLLWPQCSRLKSC